MKSRINEDWAKTEACRGRGRPCKLQTVRQRYKF